MKKSSTRDTWLLCALAGIALALPSCSVPSTAPAAERARELGVLQLESAAPLAMEQPSSAAEEWTPSPIDRRHIVIPPEVVEIADTVRAGRAVAVVVRTIAPDGCWSADGGELAKSGDTVVIRPFDRHSGAAACTAVVMAGALEHHFTTSFDSPGTGAVRVQGRRVRQAARDFGTPVTVERRVVVVP